MKKNNRLTLYKTLLFYSMLLILCIVGIVLFVPIIFDSTLFSLNRMDPLKFVNQNQALIRSNDYVGLATKLKSKVGGNYLLLDENSHVLFNNIQDMSEEEIDKEFSSDILNPSIFFVSSYMKEGKREYCVSQVYIRDSATNIYLLNDSYEVIYTNTLFNEKLSENALLHIDNSNSQTLLNSYSYTMDGKEYTMIMEVPNQYFYDLDAINKKYDLMWICIFILILIVVDIYVFVLRRTMIKPIVLLGDAIQSFDNDSYGEIEYSGPYEFEEMVNNFNEMKTSLVNSRKKEEELLQDKQTLLADISHDLKTPITVIKGYTSAIQSDMVNEETKKKYLARIDSKGDELIQLINTFNEFNKLNHPLYSYQFVKTNICEYTRMYLAEVYDEVRFHSLELVSAIPDETINVLIDPNIFSRVYENLLSNALKYSFIHTSIKFSIYEEDGWVCIDVCNVGKPIKENLKKFIFDPFVARDEERGGLGSGLGLAICKKLVEAHQGTITLKQSSEYPVIFEVRLKKVE